MKRFVFLAASAALLAGCAEKPETEAEVREELRSMIFKCNMHKQDAAEVSGEVKFIKFDFVNNSLGFSDAEAGSYDYIPSKMPDGVPVLGVVGMDEGRVFYKIHAQYSGLEMHSTTSIDRFSGRLSMEFEGDHVPDGLKANMGECELVKEDRVKNKSKF